MIVYTALRARSSARVADTGDGVDAKNISDFEAVEIRRSFCREARDLISTWLQDEKLVRDEGISTAEFGAV